MSQPSIPKSSVNFLTFSRSSVLTVGRVVDRERSMSDCRGGTDPNHLFKLFKSSISVFSVTRLPSFKFCRVNIHISHSCIKTFIGAMIFVIFILFINYSLFYVYSLKKYFLLTIYKSTQYFADYLCPHNETNDLKVMIYSTEVHI